MNFNKLIFSVFNSAYSGFRTPALAGDFNSLQPVHFFFHLPSACPERSRRVFPPSVALLLRRTGGLQPWIPLAFRFELQYSNRPTHPKTRIAAGLEPGIAFGTMSVPRSHSCSTEPWVFHVVITAPRSHDCSTPSWGRNHTLPFTDYVKKPDKAVL
jgi:hypothetical protein